MFFSCGLISILVISASYNVKIKSECSRLLDSHRKISEIHKYITDESRDLRVSI